jgi:tetratricopeptide (TPR) repeat protein
MVGRAPESEQAWINLSAALSGQGDNEQAIAAANRSIAVANGNPYTYYNRAECWMDWQKTDFAIRDYEKALRLAAYDPELTEEISNRLRLARIAMDSRMSTFEDAKYEMMGKSHGTWIVDGVEVASTLQCPHCGKHMPSTHDPGKRWFCFHCGDLVCEDADCRVCDPYLAKLDRTAKESRRLIAEGHPIP